MIMDIPPSLFNQVQQCVDNQNDYDIAQLYIYAFGSDIPESDKALYIKMSEDDSILKMFTKQSMYWIHLASQNQNKEIAERYESNAIQCLKMSLNIPQTAFKQRILKEIRLIA